MLAVLLVLLGICLVLVVLFVAAVLYDVTFHGDRILAERQQGAAAWRVPFIRGEELLRWARATAARLVGRGLAKGRTSGTPAKLAEELHSGANRALLPLIADHDAKRPVACPDEGQGMIGVTAPEAIAIADYLRGNFPATECTRIHDQARRNAELLQVVDHAHFDGREAPCPLQGDGHVCCVFDTRPLRCRPLHAAHVANQLGLPTAGIDGEIPPWASHLQTVEQGLEEGFVEGLEQAGLDAHIYELNSALALALETPDVGKRWLKGEDVFAGCKQYR